MNIVQKMLRTALVFVFLSSLNIFTSTTTTITAQAAPFETGLSLGGAGGFAPQKKAMRNSLVRFGKRAVNAYAASPYSPLFQFYDSIPDDAYAPANDDTAATLTMVNGGQASSQHRLYASPLSSAAANVGYEWVRLRRSVDDASALKPYLF